jgi:K+-transporting ATPase KdpF subunit
MVKIAFERESSNRPRFEHSMTDQYRNTFAIESFGGRQDHVGYRKCRGKHIVFCHCDWICNGVRPVRGEGDAEMIETLALGLVTVALLIYLVYALLRPEKF